MDTFIKNVTEDPQIYAAMITAVFGILGILINIIINYWFRNEDYKHKSFGKQLETLETYYVPLEEKIIGLINCITIFEDDQKMIDVILGKNGAKEAAADERVKNALSEIKCFFMEKDFKYPSDYKLFLAHKNAKEKILILCSIIDKKTISHEYLTKKTIQSDLEDLVYRIQQYENGIVINNKLVRYIEKIKLWNSNRIQRNR